MNILQKLLAALNFPHHYVGLLEQKSTRTLTIILSILYIINPFDLIPEFILGFGLIDDGILLTLLITTLLSIRRKDNEAKTLK
jgi:uncharacterized membrane protein YkvA (DUF1232 family)